LSDITPTYPLSDRSPWKRRLRTPYREFLRTETGSAVVLLLGALASLIWVNVDQHSYNSVWKTQISFHIGNAGIAQDFRGWINTGLMTFFFFVIGLEARREFDVGDLRDRRRLVLPVLAGLGGMLVPVLIFLGITSGHQSARGWGAAISTDTAFALGMLTLVGPRFSDRLRSFLLTVVVVDDLVALGVIVLAYTNRVNFVALSLSVILLILVLAVRVFGIHRGWIYAILGMAMWIALFKSGVDPLVVGLLMGLLAVAYPADRTDLERATERFRLFREQPTAELARQAYVGLQSAVSPNDRLQQLYHPWTSYLIVPLFALANTGIPLTGKFLGQAFTSPVTLGILAGLVLGKPIGIFVTSWLATFLTRGKLRPPVGWASVAGGGAIAGIGFTVSILIASLAFKGVQLQEAKVGVLMAALVASTTTWLVFWATEKLPDAIRNRALMGRSTPLLDLAVQVDIGRDHIRGPIDAPVTLVEYGDLECPYCGQAEPVVRELLADFGDLRYVWRHLPLVDVHPHAQLAAEAAEVAQLQDAFWEMHDLLFEHQTELTMPHILSYARMLGLDMDRFTTGLERHVGAARVASDVEGADLSGVSGTPTFFINGRRHFGAYGITELKDAVRAAHARSRIE
jgi:Na+/H+ antiporter NhaA